jgi:hypothetical protein
MPSTGTGAEHVGARAGVEARRLFVDEQYVEPCGDGPGELEAALFAAGEVASVDADLGGRIDATAVQLQLPG